MGRKAAYRRGGRVVEGAGLENQYTLTGIVGSNPTLSADLHEKKGTAVQCFIVMKPDATPDEIADVRQRLETFGHATP